MRANQTAYDRKLQIASPHRTRFINKRLSCASESTLDPLHSPLPLCDVEIAFLSFDNHTLMFFLLIKDFVCAFPKTNVIYWPISGLFEAIFSCNRKWTGAHAWSRVRHKIWIKFSTWKLEFNCLFFVCFTRIRFKVSCVRTIWVANCFSESAEDWPNTWTRNVLAAIWPNDTQSPFSSPSASSFRSALVATLVWLRSKCFPTKPERWVSRGFCFWLFQSSNLLIYFRLF